MSTKRCPQCDGTGHTKETAPEMELRYDRYMGAHVEVRTIKQGSGCPKCLGVGHVSVE
jgi:RecJ-like exonuclease